MFCQISEHFLWIREQICTNLSARYYNSARFSHYHIFSWLSNFFRFKDSIPLYLRFHLIEKIQSSNCNNTYYSKAERHLKVRANEHKSMSALTNKRVNNNTKSACKVRCVSLIILSFWIMGHTSLNTWWKNRYSIQCLSACKTLSYTSRMVT